MSIPSDLTRVVAFACTRDDNEKVKTIGSGFIIALPSVNQRMLHFYYATAAHVVDGVNNISIQVTGTSNTVEYIEINRSEWCFLKDTSVDVAIAPLPITIDDTSYHKAYVIENFIDDDCKNLYLGDPVYFIGLLSIIEAMRQNNIPMVRYGTVGALNQCDVPVMGHGGVKMANAHLIDCRSAKGFSGAPCFVQNPANGRTRLLGLVSGHFDESAAVNFRGSEVADISATVSMNAGVGVITPAKYLKELLMDPHLVEQRRLNEYRLT